MSWLKQEILVPLGKLLRNSEFYLILALLGQMKHTASLFYRIEFHTVLSTNDTTNLWLNWFQAYFVATALEGAVYYFVRRGDEGISWFFAVCSFFVNIIFYELNWFSGAYHILGAFLFSLMLPGAIMAYSHDRRKLQLEAKILEQAPAPVKKQSSYPGKRFKHPLKCPACSKEYQTPSALKTHTLKHRKDGLWLDDHERDLNLLLFDAQNYEQQS